MYRFFAKPNLDRLVPSTFKPMTAPLLWGSVLAALFLGMIVEQPVHASSRIKDIIDFQGVRDNMLVGYGIVVGLNGTGDDLTNSPFASRSLVGMLERMGINTRGVTLKTKNVAAVVVTAKLPSFARQGTRIDVSASALGDAGSLLGGTLLITPMVGADGEVYAVAQGPLAIGGFSTVGKAATITKNVPTNGRIANGAIVEREINFDMGTLSKVRLSLRNPNLITARRLARAVNKFLRISAASINDPGTVTLTVPPKYPGGVIGLLTDIEQIRVAPDQLARVVIDENNGVIVIGENVITITLPPLRERPQDIEMLTEHFLKKYADVNGVPERPLSFAAHQKLHPHDWRGNVRELENTTHRAVLLAQGDEIRLDAIILSNSIARDEDNNTDNAANGSSEISTAGDTLTPARPMVGRKMSEVERDLIINTVFHCLGNRTHAANILGISIRTLRNKLKQYSEDGVAIPTPNTFERAPI